MIFIYLAAFALRITGIQFGLPNLYHQDEPILVNHALAMGVSGSLNPHFFIIPGFSIYLLFFIYGVYFLAGSALGLFAGKESFAITFLKNPSDFYLAGRVVFGVIFGVLTIQVLRRIGARFFTPKVGVIAGLILAVTPIHVQHGHYLYADVILTYAVTLFFFYTASIMEDPKTDFYWRAGAVLGWAIAVKYTAAYFIPGAILVHFLANGKDRFTKGAFRKLALAMAWALAVFTLCAPYTFLAWSEFYSQMLRQAAAESPVGWTHHAVYSLWHGAGFGILALALAGTVYMVRDQRKIAPVLLLFILPYYGINVYFGQTFARYALPIVPLIALAASKGFWFVSKRFGFGRGLRIILLVLVLAEPLKLCLASNRLFLTQDTRTECARWFEGTVPPGSKIALDNRFFGPHLWQSPDQILQKGSGLDGQAKSGVRQKRIQLAAKISETRINYYVWTLKNDKVFDAEPVFVFEGPYLRASADEILNSGIEYVVLNYSEIVPEIHSLKEAMKGHWKLEKTFSPFFNARQKIPSDPHSSTAAPHLPQDIHERRSLGPYLEIYKVSR